MTEPTAQGPQRRGLLTKVLLGAVVTVALFLAVALLGGHVYSAPSTSMEPGCQPGCHLWATSFGSADRGQVIVMTKPAGFGGQRTVVRRIVAVGGDMITADSTGHVIVNGKRISEPYVAADQPTFQLERVTVPKGEVYVLGDKRTISQDSRAYGPVPVADIVGYVRFTF